MSNAQEELIRQHFAHVVVMLDGDDAGRGASAGIGDRLRRIVYQVDVVTLADGIQPDQLLEDEIYQVLNGITVAQ